MRQFQEETTKVAEIALQWISSANKFKYVNHEKGYFSHKKIKPASDSSDKQHIEYFMESARVRCLHTSCGVSEIEQVSEANE